MSPPSPLLHRFLQRLESVKPSAHGFSARCPVHDDRSPSLSIKEGEDGRVLLHCFAGCPPQEVVAVLGLTMADLFPENGQLRRPPPAPGVTRTALHAAVEIEQQVLFIVAYDRVKGKSISPTDAARERLAKQRIELARRAG
ncbi:hypothetical protein [Variovorax boronicumulans]|uniref:hypothetical protein n=1 Tax=Variovorax boronicumulans TaxID=436515 RepID=UPI000785AA19|nr:hypothetical protein [Variovorax boronicumulans]